MPNWTSMSGGCGQLDEEEQRKMKKEGKRQKNKVRNKLSRQIVEVVRYKPREREKVNIEGEVVSRIKLREKEEHIDEGKQH